MLLNSCCCDICYTPDVLLHSPDSSPADGSSGRIFNTQLLSHSCLRLWVNVLLYNTVAGGVEVLHFCLILSVIAQACTAKMNLSEEVDLEDYVGRPDKISNAEISAICQEAGMHAVRKNRYGRAM